MKYVLIKDKRNTISGKDLDVGNIYDVEYAYTDSISNLKLYCVSDVVFDHLISEQELEEYFIPMIVYRRNKIIGDLI